MPELPEVETTVRGLRPVLAGRRLVRVEVRRPTLRRAIPPELATMLTGATVTALDRRAKYGLIHVDRGHTLVFHLGMTGRWRIDAHELGPHDHLVLETDDGRTLALNDARRFGSLDLVATEALPSWGPFAGLGPEPLGPDLTVAGLAARLAGRRTAIKPLLLDQRVVAGLGNIYVCEALNLVRIDPRTAGGALTPARLRRLVAAIPPVLAAAIAAGGSTLRDYAQPDGRVGYFSDQFRVYGRAGDLCPCGKGVVERRVDGGRSTFWCRACQR